MWNDAVKEIDNWKEATRQARQVKRGKRWIQQADRRSRQNGRSHPHQAEKESDQDASSGKICSQRQKQKRPRKEEVGGGVKSSNK